MSFMPGEMIPWSLGFSVEKGKTTHVFLVKLTSMKIAKQFLSYFSVWHQDPLWRSYYITDHDRSTIWYRCRGQSHFPPPLGSSYVFAMTHPPTSWEMKLTFYRSPNTVLYIEIIRPYLEKRAYFCFTNFVSLNYGMPLGTFWYRRH